ncbi:hypothetical protein [Oerskovia paurometabola]|uniref:hypothetical protein n=1 Tax=Oerskovia paurometabola TaxID=162170 RepID=UPI00341A7503
MAREFARTNISIWQDEDFRALPPAAQHLFFVLWNHPTLSYAGVVDWRPGRLSGMAGNWAPADVQAAADCLEARLFIVIDPVTEECLIRSWARWDGLLKQPRMAVSFANAFAEIASADLRGVLVHQTQKLNQIEPDLTGWAKPQVQTILAKTGLDPRARALPKDPFGDGFAPSFAPGFGPGLGETQDSVSVPVSVPPTPAPAPTPLLLSGHVADDAPPTAPADAVAKPKKSTKDGTRIPEPFVVTPAMVEWARTETPGLNHKATTDRFIDYWRAAPGAKGVKLDWVAVWRNWLRKEHADTVAPARPEPPRQGGSFWNKTVTDPYGLEGTNP